MSLELVDLGNINMEALIRLKYINILIGIIIQWLYMEVKI